MVQRYLIQEQKMASEDSLALLGFAGYTAVVYHILRKDALHIAGFTDQEKLMTLAPERHRDYERE